MDMDYKPNNYEHNSQTTTAGQPARAAASYHQLFLALIFVLFERIKNIFQQLKDDCMMCWFNLQNMVRSLVNLMQIISPVGDDHNEGMKGEEFHIEKQNQKELEEDKENDINMVGQSSEHFCSVCLEFKGKSDMLRLRDKCNHPFCNGNISNHVAAQIQQIKDDCVQFRMELQRFSDMMENLMNRTSVVDKDHGQQKKTEEFHVQKQKEEDKENNTKVVDQPSECVCGICLDFIAESDMFRGGVDATSVIGVGQNGSSDIHANGHQST
ncbi:hypothetical protein TanjilG_04910 [Lupinus angustifolius]|uniref:Uncharacterized protein n=1 Tax=Lupinus angustifolius TaxID=3871 RepID=A0A394DDY8_LUPAN|nr:hypothetical protein TanjilG_04910 [Lupinus angustifolius]